MIIEKINKFISIAIENSNLEKQDFSSLNGKKITIILSNTSTIINIKINDENIMLQESNDVEPDLSLEGSPIAFINYFNNVRKPRHKYLFTCFFFNSNYFLFF